MGITRVNKTKQRFHATLHGQRHLELIINTQVRCAIRDIGQNKVGNSLIYQKEPCKSTVKIPPQQKYWVMANSNQSKHRNSCNMLMPNMPMPYWLRRAKNLKGAASCMATGTFHNEDVYFGVRINLNLKHWFTCLFPL